MKKEEEKKKKKRKKEPNNQPRKKKKSQSGQKLGWYCLLVPHVCLIIKMPLTYE